MTRLVKFDDRVWGRLASMADNQGTTIPDLLERAVERLVVGTTRTAHPSKETRREELAQSRAAHKAALVEQITRMRDKGATIWAISHETGYSQTYVSKILCDNGRRTWTRKTETEAEGQNARDRAARRTA